MLTKEDIEALAKLVGIEPSTLDCLNVPASHAEQVPTLRMSRRQTYEPLTPSELDALGEVFHVAPQARVSGSTILNDLLCHVAGTPWDSLEEAAAARTRLRRSARRREFAALAAFVSKHANVFSAHRVEAFRRLAALEFEVATRL